MALTDHNILITPSRGSSSDPTIAFTGADASNSATITLRVLNSATTGILSFEGSSGQLFSIVDDLSGVIFSVNDISGLPSIEVLDTGEIRLAQYSGYVNVLSSTAASSTTTGALVVKGGTGIGQDLYVGGTIYGNIVGSITGDSSTASTVITVQNLNTSAHYLTFVDSNNTSPQSENLYTTSSITINPSVGSLKTSGLISTPQIITVTQATTTLDFALADHFHLTLETNTIFSITNVISKIGSNGNIIIKQDAVGGRTFTKAAEMKTPIGGAAIDQWTSPNSVSILSYYIVDTSTILVNYMGNFA